VYHIALLKSYNIAEVLETFQPNVFSDTFARVSSSPRTILQSAIAWKKEINFVMKMRTIEHMLFQCKFVCSIWPVILVALNPYCVVVLQMFLARAGPGGTGGAAAPGPKIIGALPRYMHYRQAWYTSQNNKILVGLFQAESGSASLN
jgi:hypothetical protein